MLAAKNMSEILCHARGPTRSVPALLFHARYSHTVTAKSSYVVASSEKDPYQYQVGFGNRFVSEALCVVFRRGRRAPLSLTQRRTTQAWGTPSGTKFPTKGQIWAIRRGGE
jgi:hypothetical protein